MSGHDWSQYEPSPAKNRQGWFVVAKREDGTAIEAFVTSTPGDPVKVAWVTYGPRGSARPLLGGTIANIEQDRTMLSVLAVHARELTAHQQADFPEPE